MENIISNYIIGEALIMVPVLWVVGYIIKNAGALNSKYIPIVLLAISVAFTPALLGGYTAMNIVQAVLVAGDAVFADQLYKQLSDSSQS